MNIIFHIIILNLSQVIFSSIVVLPFELNQINFKKGRYSATELINTLFETEFYTPIQLGEKGQKYFGIISFDDHHPILSGTNCEKIQKFSNNKDIIKEGYYIDKSNTKKYLGNTTNYLNSLKFVEFYSEYFWYYNETLNETNKNNIKSHEIFLIMDNYTKPVNPQKCLSIGLSEPFKVYSTPSPPHLIDDLRSKRKISTQDWTIKFTDQNEGQLIIGDLPHKYEEDIVKYSEDNYTKCNTECIVTFFQPWGIGAKEIYFNNITNDKIIVNKNNNKLVLVYNFGFIIGSNHYKDLINQYYFQNLITQNICVLEKSNITKYNKTHYFIKSEGDFSVYICQKEKMKNHLKDFPNLYFSHIKYEYIFELTYKDLFKEINDYYYFMVIFPNLNSEDYDVDEKQEWHLGIPFLRRYQFVLNFDYKSVGFYKFKNLDYQDEDNNNEKKNNGKKKGISKVLLIILEVLIVLILIIVSFFIGKFVSKQRKKRANELKDEDYEYIEGNAHENENKLSNENND